MRITVFGSTGKAGQEVIKQALERGLCHQLAWSQRQGAGYGPQRWSEKHHFHYGNVRSEETDPNIHTQCGG